MNLLLLVSLVLSCLLGLPLIIFYAVKYYCIWWLKRYFKKQLKEQSFLPSDVRHEISKQSKKDLPWQVKFLLINHIRRNRTHKLNHFLKYFSEKYFGYSKNYISAKNATWLKKSCTNKMGACFRQVPFVL